MTDAFPTPSGQTILLTPMEENSLKAATIGQFLGCLTGKIFSRDGLYGGTETFAQNQWEEDLAYALVLHGHIEGTISEAAELVHFNANQFDDALKAATALLRDADYSTLALPPEPKEYYLIEFSKEGDILDQEGNPYHKESAKALLKLNYSGRYDTGWRIVHIPSVT